MRRAAPSARYVIHQIEPPAQPDTGDIGRWCIVDSGGATEAEATRLQDSADSRQAFVGKRDPDGHHLFMVVTVDELREMGLGPALLGDKPPKVAG